MYHVFLEQLHRQEGTEQNHLAGLLCHQELSCQFYQVHVFLTSHLALQLSQDSTDVQFQNQFDKSRSSQFDLFQPIDEQEDQS